MKRLAIVIGVLLVVGGIALALLARSVLTGDNVRAAVAAQVSAAIGQPVTIQPRRDSKLMATDHARCVARRSRRW